MTFNTQRVLIEMVEIAELTVVTLRNSLPCVSAHGVCQHSVALGSLGGIAVGKSVARSLMEGTVLIHVAHEGIRWLPLGLSCWLLLCCAFDWFL